MMSSMAVDRVRRGSNALWMATAVFALAGPVLTLVGWRDMIVADGLANVASGLAGAAYATIGALIVRRTGNLIGWLLEGIGLGLALLSTTGAYAVVGLATFPPSLLAPGIVGAFATGVFVPTAVSMAFLLFFFPSGTLPSRQWRPIVAIGVVATALTAVGVVVNPVRLNLPAPGGGFHVPNPLGIGSFAGPISTVLVGTTWAIVLSIGAAFGAIVVRFRTGGRELREQIKWVAFVAALALLAQVVAAIGLVACGCDSSPVATVAFTTVVFLVFLGMPAALAIAILKYRLYDIDVVINRAVVYTLLAAAFTLVYVGIVVGIGSVVGSRRNPLLTIIAAVAIALLFQPLRERARRLANRLVYGDRATPYQVLSDFAERMGGTYGLDDVAERMASILAQGTGATRVDVWLRVGAELRPAAVWPAGAEPRAPVRLGPRGELPAFESVTRAVSVRHDEEVLGALSLEKPRNEPLTPTEDTLLQDLASQAGLVLRNVRLTAELRATIDELRASRRRLVGAQNAERRKIERNLHDGAQQQLVALGVKLGLLGRFAADPDRVQQVAGQLQDGLRAALDDLRDLARGIYPPLLADKGLAVALEAQARKAAVGTTVESNGVGRYPEEVESAVYFCALEAMQNVAKYAEASSTVVRLAETEGDLVFEIEDDGRGFNPDETGYGTGLQGMADRLDAIGATLEVASEPARGTLVRGRIRLPGNQVAEASGRSE
jgi:signal transduction histidine kinase